jgi:stringent starvation protein B
MHELTSTRPYLVRAIYQWIEDNSLTPYILVDTTAPLVDVPLEYVRNGRIVLNISSVAVRNLALDDDVVTFSARFGGVARDIYVPIVAVLAIYSKENGKGMFFDQDGDIEPPPKGGNSSEKARLSTSNGHKTRKTDSRPKLKVVK